MSREELKDALLALKRGHYMCEDPWYSCPLSEEGCADERAEGCTCGEDTHNDKIDAIVAAL